MQSNLQPSFPAKVADKLYTSLEAHGMSFGNVLGSCYGTWSRYKGSFFCGSFSC